MLSTAATIVSFRLGEVDGVSVEAAKWADALGSLGITVRTVAGSGRADELIPGLDIGAETSASSPQIRAALGNATTIVVENMFSLPLNPAGSTALARALGDRRAIVRHHDLPWELAMTGSVSPWPLGNRHWIHVCTSDHARCQLRKRGIRARRIHNRFAAAEPTRPPAWTRRALGLTDDETILLQPTRVLARKNVGQSIAVAGALGATLWVTGPVLDGYAEAFRRIEAASACTLVRGLPAGVTIADAYVASNIVMFPSTSEGFGNPVLEAAVYRRPVAVTDYPVLRELSGFGFRWLNASDVDSLARWLNSPNPAVLEHNAEVARRHFALETLPSELETLLRAVPAREPGDA